MNVGMIMKSLFILPYTQRAQKQSQTAHLVLFTPLIVQFLQGAFVWPPWPHSFCVANNKMWAGTSLWITELSCVVCVYPGFAAPACHMCFLGGMFGWQHWDWPHSYSSICRVLHARCQPLLTLLSMQVSAWENTQWSCCQPVARLGKTWEFERWPVRLLH